MPNIDLKAFDLAEQARYQSALDAIDPAALDYDEWLRVGMACKDAGLSCDAWDDWSRADADRYEPNMCAEKWDTFTSEGVGAGTLIYMASQSGWDGTSRKPRSSVMHKMGHVGRTTAAQQAAPPLDLSQLDYADDIGDYPTMAQDFTPDEMMREQLRFMFDSDEWVCVGATTSDVRSMRAGEAVEHAGELLANGAQFICVNPTNGKGRKNSDVAAWRYTLIESDTLPKDEQLDIMRRLRLPCATITDSGNKSVHAVVHIDAEGVRGYRERVAFVQAVCNANGLQVDAACKNPARLTRLAGATRAEGQQRLIDVACSPFNGYDDWREWVTERAPRRADEPMQATVVDDGGKPADERATSTTAPIDGEQAGSADSSTGKGAKGKGKKDRAPSQADLVQAMRSDPALCGKFGTNELDGGLYVTGALPWDESGEYRRWTDADTELLFCHMQATTKTKSRRNVAGAFTIMAAAGQFNPIADMLDSLPEWDGTARADYLLWVLFGCEDSPYTRAVSHTFMRGAVLRGYEAGCKFDSVLTLIGPQGCGKSYGTRRMAMRDEFLCESVSDLTDHKLTAEQTMGRWLCELPELEGMTGRRLTGVKQAITLQRTTVRLAYAHHPVDLPRSCCFIATTNETAFLADRTGNRRFWPIRCATTSRDGWESASDRELTAFVAMAWAEVVREYKTARAEAADSDEFKAMYPTTLPPDIERVADTMREAASVEDTRVGVVRDWLENTALMEGTTRVCARMVAERALGIDMARQRGHQLTNEVAFILDSTEGWQAVGKQRVRGYGTCKAWEYQTAARA